MIRACPQNHSRNLHAPLCWKWGRYFKLVLKHTSYDTSKEQKEYKMLYFENDYCEGAHEAILKRLLETNMEKVRDMDRTLTVTRQRRKSRLPAAARMERYIFWLEEPRQMQW